MSLRDIVLIATLLLPAPVSAQQAQNAVINIPAYELKLTTDEGEHVFPVAVGKGSHGRIATPVAKGTISDKRERVIFRYGKNYPDLGIKANSVIYWTNTFDDEGNPIGYRMPYKDMRGLGMLLTDSDGRAYDQCVIHSTTDEFTIGSPSSSCCIRVGMDEMKVLYDLVDEVPIPIETVYNLVEVRNDKVILHADVYHTGIDTAEEFRRIFAGSEISPEIFDYNLIREEFTKAQGEFHEAHEEILEILSNPHPKNYVPPDLRERLHRRFPLESFLKQDARLP